jgi:hypothetical protein
MGKYDEFIKEQLKAKWPLLGNELSSALIEKYGIEPDNARKIIQRATQKGIMVSSTPLTFSKGQFLYLKPGLYFGLEIVKDAAEFSRKPLYRLLEVLDKYKIISFYEGLKITASPDEKGSSKISLLIDMVNQLETLGIVFTQTDSRGNNYISVRNAIPPILRRGFSNEAVMEAHYQAMKLDAVFVPDILRWMKRINLIDLGASYRSVASPAIGVKHNDIMWDAYAYTKTTGINPSRASQADEKEKQTLVVMDVMVSRKYLQADLDGFLARVQINLNAVQNGKRKVLPIVVFHEIDELTLNRLKMLGFLAFDLKTIFGANIGEMILNFRKIFSGFSEQAEEAIEPALKIIDESGLTDQLRALRGALFEALMYPVIKKLYPDSQVMQGKRLTNLDKTKTREFDLIFIASHPNEILLVELKGYTGKSYIPLGSQDEKDSLRYFFRGSVPIAQDFYKANPALREHRVTAAYITTGNFHSDTSNFVSKVKDSGLKPSQFDMLFNGVALEQFLTEKGFNHEAGIIKKYYPQPSENDYD